MDIQMTHELIMTSQNAQVYPHRYNHLNFANRDRKASTMTPAATEITPTSEHSFDHAEMKDLMEKWDADGGATATTYEDDGRTGSDYHLDYDDALEKYRRSINPGSNEIDHILLGTSDFDKAMELFQELTGDEPVMVVSLNGLGTKSARLAFESCAFLEIVGPDPKQGSTPMGDKLKEALPSDGTLVPLHYAVRHDEATTTLKKTTRPELGYSVGQVSMVAKDKGMPWKWDMIFLENHTDGGLAPIFTHWGEATHGAAKLPIMGKLTEVIVQAPIDNKVHDLIRTTDGVAVRSGSPKLEFTFTSKKGEHTFTSEAPIGISFPPVGGLNPEAKKEC